MINTLPKSLIEAAKSILEPTTKLNWAIGENKKHAQAPYRQTAVVWLNAHEVLPKIHPDWRVTPDDMTNHIGNRMQRAIDHFKSGKFMGPPDISVGTNHQEYPIFVGNGRHRIAASVALGHSWFPASVDPEEIEELKKHIEVKKDMQ